MKYLILFFSVMIGFYLGKKIIKSPSITKLLLVFSAGFLLTICLTELFPTVYTLKGKSIGVWILLGVLFQLIIEFFSKGIEHGHTHFNNTKTIPLGIVVGLLLHAFLEGIPLTENGDTHIHNLWLAVALHKIPIAIIFGSAVFSLEIDQKEKYSLLLLFAIITPLGMWVGTHIPQDYGVYLTAINGGIFLHISSLIIFESNKNHIFNYQKAGVLLLGIVLGLLL